MKIILFLISFVLITLTSHAQPIVIKFKDTDVIKAIIGEAEGESSKGKLAVACAIRNRGSLKGVYGLHAPRVKQHRYSEETKNEAIDAWVNSENPDNCVFIQGAQYWEGDNFKRPYWTKDMIETVHVGHQRFYRSEP